MKQKTSWLRARTGAGTVIRHRLVGSGAMPGFRAENRLLHRWFEDGIRGCFHGCSGFAVLFQSFGLRRLGSVLPQPCLGVPRESFQVCWVISVVVHAGTHLPPDGAKHSVLCLTGLSLRANHERFDVRQARVGGGPLRYPTDEVTFLHKSEALFLGNS